MSKSSESNSIRVICRFRPFNKLEAANGSKKIVTVSSDRTSLKIKGNESDHTFSFDRVFDENETQRQVYDDSARPVVDDILAGYNGTIFVYGQTGSGKTHTMQGPSIDNDELKGIIPRMIEQVFEGISNADENIEFIVKASYIEIYMEKIRDLLDERKDNLKVREEKGKGIWVDGATEVYIAQESDVLNVIRTGMSNRAIAFTKMNAESSRSHSVFILNIQQKSLKEGSVKTGKLYLVDLAGSEKVEKTGASGTTLDEAKMINKSLSALGNVINALTDGKSQHIPYRDSKLTRILQESLGGNSRTTLIINCSPSSYNEAETLSTLRFGNRAKSIKNKAKINKEMSAGELKLLLAKSEAEIEKLKLYIKSLEEEIGISKGKERPQTAPLSNSSSASKPKPNEIHPHVSELQNRLNELEEKLTVEEEEKKNLQDLVDSLQDQVNEKDQEMRSQFEVLTSIKEDLSKYTQEVQTLTKENSQLSMQISDSTMKYDKLKYEVTSKDLEIDSLKTEAENLRAEIEELKTHIANNTTNSAPQENTNTVPIESTPSSPALAAREQWEEKELQIKKQLEEGLIKVESEKIEKIEKAFQSKINDLENVISELEGKNRVMLDDEIGSKDKIKAMEMKNLDLTKEVQQKGLTITKFEERLVKAEERIQELQDENTLSLERLATAEAMAMQAQQDLEILQTQYDSLLSNTKNTNEEKTENVTEESKPNEVSNVQQEKPQEEPPMIRKEENLPRPATPSPFIQTESGLSSPEVNNSPRIRDSNFLDIEKRSRGLSFGIFEKEKLFELGKLEQQLSLAESRVAEKSAQLQMLETKCVETETQLAIQNSEIERLQNENVSQKVRIGNLHQECAKLEQNIRSLTTSKNEEAARMEAELTQLRQQTKIKLEEFSTIKEALLQDLDNRCQKVIELEIILDSAQDKYSSLMNQIKKSGGKSIINDIQKKLDEATSAKHQLSIENNKLRIDHQSARKQLALRDEHIYSLENLLKENQVRFHKLAESYETVSEELAKLKIELEINSSNHNAINNHLANSNFSINTIINRAGRVNSSGDLSSKIARPLRGGGGTKTTSNSNLNTNSNNNNIIRNNNNSIISINDITNIQQNTSIVTPSTPINNSTTSPIPSFMTPPVNTLVPSTPTPEHRKSFWDLFDFRNTPKKEKETSLSSNSPSIPSTPNFSVPSTPPSLPTFLPQHTPTNLTSSSSYTAAVPSSPSNSRLKNSTTTTPNPKNGRE